MEDLIKAKAKGEVQVVRHAVKEPRQTQDLIAALKASLAKPQSIKDIKKANDAELLHY